MAKKQHLDDILRSWSYDPQAITVRVVKGADQRELLQVRVDLGVLQLETSGRPDGERPHGYETYYDHLQGQAFRIGAEFEMTDDDCQEADREFVQFYHRRVCWLALREYGKAVADADHTLAFMDFCTAHSPDEQWTISHEQYRPFVIFHRTQAAALAQKDADNPNGAIEEINTGLEKMRQVFARYEAEEAYDDDEMVQRLTELREYLRNEFHVGRTLQEQLADAVAAEQYERAAQIRDQLARRGPQQR